MSDSVLGDELLSGCGVWVVRLTAACEALKAALARLSAEPTTTERRDTRIEQSVPVPGSSLRWGAELEGYAGDVPSVETAVALLLLRGRRGRVLHLRKSEHHLQRDFPAIGAPWRHRETYGLLRRRVALGRVTLGRVALGRRRVAVVSALSLAQLPLNLLSAPRGGSTPSYP